MSAFPSDVLSNAELLPTWQLLRDTLIEVVREKNGGLGFHMWVSLVDRDGVVRAVGHSGNARGDQWPGSRIISVQKAYTANAFSLPKFALSTANLFSVTQPGGTLFGLQHSNPVDTMRAYQGNAEQFGTTVDPLVGHRAGGINVFGGGVALYTERGLIGAIGVSGDTSVTDHIIAWKVRQRLNMDFVPAGVSPASDDNMILDFKDGKSIGGWGHPSTSEEATQLILSLRANLRSSQ